MRDGGAITLDMLLCRSGSILEVVVCLEWFPMIFCAWNSSSLEDLPESAVAGRDIRDLVVTTEILELFRAVLGDTTGLDLSESREGGSGLSGKFDV